MIPGHDLNDPEVILRTSTLIILMISAKSWPGAEGSRPRTETAYIPSERTSKIIKKLLNHSSCAGLAWGYSERCFWFVCGGVACHPVWSKIDCVVRSFLNRSFMWFTRVQHKYKRAKCAFQHTHTNHSSSTVIFLQGSCCSNDEF